MKNIIDPLKKFIHRMRTPAIDLDKEIHITGEVRMTLPKKELSIIGLSGYVDGEVVNRYADDDRMVKIEKRDGDLYLNGKRVLLSMVGDLIYPDDRTRKALTASVSDFLHYNRGFIPLKWQLECCRQRADGVMFLGTTWVSGQNHACRILVPRDDSQWYYTRKHDSTWCRESGHKNDVLSAYIVENTIDGTDEL